MSDIRRLSLDETKDKQIVALSVDRYKLGWQRVEELEKLLVQLDTYGYWSPEFQAWYPAVQTYLQSGVNPELAEKWAEKLANKATVIGPDEMPNSKLFSQVLAARRTTSCEIFEGYSWEAIVKFTEMLPKYIDNEKVLRNYLYNAGNYTELLTSLAHRGAYQPYSPYLVEAVYLYRHCMLDENPAPASVVSELQQQLAGYTAQFAGAFENVIAFLGDSVEEYGWYTPKVKALIVNAWNNSLDLYGAKSVITANDVFDMPSWLSEQVNHYLLSLPCVMTSPVTQQFVFDALEYAFLPSATLADPKMIYAFCIPPDYLKSLIETLSSFYWDVKEGRLVPYMMARIEAQYTNSDRNGGMTPDEYRQSLASRGFPLEGI